MNPQLKIVRDYLKGIKTYEDLSARQLPFITISRSAGAGGHLVGYVISTEFQKQDDQELFGGWHVFDREIAELLADDPELQLSLEELQTEDYHSEFEEILTSLFAGQARQYLRYRKTFEIVRLLAMIGKVIIVGGFGACVARDLPRGLHLRLEASHPTREQRVMKKFRLSKDEAHGMIVKQDRARRKLVKSFFSREIDDPLGYDAVWNTDRVHPYEIAASAIGILKLRQACREEDSRGGGQA